MGRKLFMRHLNEVAASPPPELSNIHSPDEGITAFTFSYAINGQARSCELKLLALDTDEYPDGNTYMLFTDDDGVDKSITSRLEVITAVLMGKPLKDALAEISQALQIAVRSGHAGNPIAVEDSDLEDEEYNNDSDDDLGEYDIDDADFGFDTTTKAATGITSKPALASRSRPGGPSDLSADLHKIKSDLRTVKEAGFRVGVYGNLTSGGIICVSIRVTKLGISEEAMEAWGLRRSHYLVLMIRFLHGYRSLEVMCEDSISAGLTEMRVALCEHYKPTREDALEAFGQKSKEKEAAPTNSPYPLEPLFIASPLNELLRDRFPNIVKFRQSLAFNWPSAEAFAYEIQGKPMSTLNEVDPDDHMVPDDTMAKALPDIVKADAVDSCLLKDASLPLVAMQFALRHLVRCTEFCLVCHCKLGDTFEALKPYVCSNPLCLFQYMALGFGPRIEWEILSQPYVVDLLISFCYAAAQQGRLKEFPVGIDLKVPMLPRYKHTLAYARYGSGTSAQDPPGVYDKPTFTARMNFEDQELIMEPDQKSQIGHLRVGDWLVICNASGGRDLHFRILDAMFPTFRLSVALETERPTFNDQYQLPASSKKVDAASSTPTKSDPLPSGFTKVECYTYEARFDDLTKNEQQHAIMVLLETLPSVLDMQNFLKLQSGHESTLKAWRNQISDSALNLLRWIIASNRSCIMQVGTTTLDGSKAAAPSNDRVIGMDNWMQFRFAQGAPDKEQRFVDSVKRETGDKKYPTFFAWHGSPIGNWHSIIRQGLRFDETLHGRAFGNGVYMAPSATTSLGYSSMGYSQVTWPQSALKVLNALSLQEVVNKPETFVSKSPHYVVADIDWIQTRYLFVQKTGEGSSTASSDSFIEYEQEPSMVASDDKNKPIKVPITAVSKSRRPAVASSATRNGTKRTKSLSDVDQATAEQIEDDANSTVSDMDDLAWFSDSNATDSDEPFLDDEGYLSFADERTPVTTAPSSRASSTKKNIFNPSLTDFRPGTLDVSNIKFLDAPTNGTPSANKALMTAYQDALKIQNTTATHELGWYMNPDHFENMYQWIVELHSFPATLPLAEDMKAAGVTSIVLEMRFTNQFPFSPPFIRVVKPRFLPFNQGGGGHVTEGGAICMELLTNSGWSAVTSMEAVLLQVQLAMGDEERPARLLGKGYGRGEECYGVGEAVAAYERACRAHGWKVPDGFGQFAGMG